MGFSNRGTLCWNEELRYGLALTLSNAILVSLWKKAHECKRKDAVTKVVRFILTVVML